MDRGQLQSIRSRVESVHRRLKAQELLLREVERVVDAPKSDIQSLHGMVYTGRSMCHELQQVLDTPNDELDNA